MPEPLPVRLVAVADVRLATPSGCERELDDFYVAMLGFERLPDENEEFIFTAENFAIRFGVIEPPISREHFRPLGIEVASMAEVEQRLIDAEIEHARQKGLVPGQESLVLLDPAGNWVELIQSKTV